MLCCGDATDPATWSGTPQALLQAGLQTGLLQGGLALQPQRLRWRRRAWNLLQLLRSGRPGGFQYSTGFCRALLVQARLPPDQPLALLSHYPLLPLHPWPSAWRVAFYIDATTTQVLEAYGFGSRIAPSLQRQLLERERCAYHQAQAVIAMSPWAARSLSEHYGLPPERVAVVPAGANLHEAALASLPPAPAPPPPGPEHPLRLGLLGKEWQRKGGPFLLQLVEALDQLGIPAQIRVLGIPPAQLPSHPAIQPLGFIDKQQQPARFVAELRSWHFGTLFSQAEAFGIAARECLRLGVPVLAHAVGGILATLPDDGCGQLFPAHPHPTEVAHWLAARLTPYAGYLQWRQALAGRWQEFTWATAVRRLAAVLDAPASCGPGQE
ncbi:MAG: glycosyltransferase family 4 protein [Cyanobium sp. M30B3]|nr:MAG: glycosyltransferase family 4 protein [Cyanobium sp. M30B3]